MTSAHDVISAADVTSLRLDLAVALFHGNDCSCRGSLSKVASSCLGGMIRLYASCAAKEVALSLVLAPAFVALMCDSTITSLCFVDGSACGNMHSVHSVCCGGLGMASL